ncbi:MAG: hypothetical protein WA908_11840 [Pontixanthobacter sp.]
MSNKIEDLGDWAEDRFALYCSQAGVVANKSSKDRTGWDYLLEFAQANSTSLPPDLHKKEAAARAQVKSRKRGKLSATIKLDNAHRFAASPDPCFIVLAAATDGAEPVRFYAKHFWKPEIERTLKRLRQAESKSKPVHKQSFSVVFDKEDDHTDDLIEWMRGIASQDRTAYSAEKQKLNKTLGYEDGNAVGTVTFALDDFEAFVDHSIGLTPKINLTHVRMVDRRFGIEAKKPLFEGKPDYAVMQSNPKACAIEVVDVDDRSHTFEGEFRAPGLPGLPKDMFKARVIAGPVKMVLNGDGVATVNITFHSSEVHELAYLTKCVDLYAAAGKGPVEVILHVNGERLDGVTTDELKTEHGGLFYDCAILLRSLSELAEQAGQAKPRLSLDQIIHGFEEIRYYLDHVVAESLTVDLTLRPDRESDPVMKRLLFPCTLQIGEVKFSAVRAFRHVDEEKNGDDRKLRFSQPSMLHVQVDEADLSEHQKTMDDIVRRNSKKHGEGGLVMRAEGSDHHYPIVVATEVSLRE